MKLIAITPDLPHRYELQFVKDILDVGFDYVHIRKPDYSIDQLREYLNKIPENMHQRLKLHSHFSLANEFEVAGVHLNKRFPDIPEGLPAHLKLSRSCHAASELRDLSRYEYVFLSPIFNSISKRGYTSRFSQGDLIEAFKHPDTKDKVVALGGIMPAHIIQLHRLGFIGAAFLGFLFNNDDEVELQQKLSNIKNIIKCYNL